MNGDRLENGGNYRAAMLRVGGSGLRAYRLRVWGYLKTTSCSPYV